MRERERDGGWFLKREGHDEENDLGAIRRRRRVKRGGLKAKRKTRQKIGADQTLPSCLGFQK